MRRPAVPTVAIRAAQFFPEKSIDTVLTEFATSLVGAAQAADLTNAWKEFEEALMWQPLVGLYCAFGFCWQRTWDRPFVPDAEAVPAAEREYYERHGCFQHNNPGLIDLGKDVLVLMDSVTRFAMAQREIGLSAGEPPTAKGYTPTVFVELPRLLERAGPGPEGTGAITGIFSVLVDGDDHNDPVADNIRGTLDGHIVLERFIADRGRYPAINPLTSISRLARQVWTPDQMALVRRFCALIARFEDTRDLRIMGGYAPGHDPDLDQAVAIAADRDARIVRGEDEAHDPLRAGLDGVVGRLGDARRLPVGTTVGFDLAFAPQLLEGFHDLGDRPRDVVAVKIV